MPSEEIRRIQETNAGATLVTIPKKFAKDLGLVRGKYVLISLEDREKELRIKPLEMHHQK